MQIERRRMVRRAISGSVLLAPLSVLPLCLLELLYVVLVRRPVFGSLGEAIWFGVFLFLLPLSLGALFGALEGLVILGVSQLTALVARRRVNEAAWMAWIYSLLVLPGIAMVAAKTFAGRRAQLIPGKDLIAIALGVVGLFGAYAAFRLIIAVRDRFRLRRWGPRQAGILAPALLLVSAVLYLTDQRVLAGLYGFFHLGLALGALAFCQLSAGALYAAWRPTARWIGRLAEPSISVFVVVAGVAGAAWSVSGIARSQGLRYLYFQHTAIQAKALALVAGLGLQGSGLAPPAPAEPVAAPLGAEPPRGEFLPGPRRPEANVLLISVDALRADHMGAYGYGRATTPHLDRWARGGAVFDRPYCQVPHTSFSVTSLMTGTYVYALNAVDPGHRYTTLAEVLRRYGYKTGAFFPPAVFYIDQNNFTAFEKARFGFEYVKYEYLDADQRVDQALAFLKEYKSRRIFLWIHFFEPHEPYDRHPGFEFGPRAVDRYDGEIAYVDQQVGRLLDYVKREMPDTYVAVTADHGEEFGEHGAHYHGSNLYDPQVRVPLVMGGPGIKARHIAGAAQVIDLPATLLSLVDVPPSARMRGTDLGPWLAGEAASRLPPAFSEMERKKLVVYRGHKLLCDTARGFCELYDLDRDPMERQNLIGRRPDIEADLRRRLDGWMASHVLQPQGIDREAEVAALLDRGRQKDPGSVPGLLRLLSGPLEVRREAVQLLTLMRAGAAKDALQKATADADPGVRVEATVGAALLGDRRSLPKLEELLRRRDLPRGLRRDALLAQAKTGDRRATADLSRTLMESQDIYERIELVEVLGALGDPAASAALRGQLETLRVRLYAIQALGQVRATSAVPDLIGALTGDRFTSWRKAAATALGQIGDARAAPVLRDAVRHEVEPDVAGEALLSLVRLRALRLPGVTPLRFGDWICGSSSCTLSLGVDCGAAQGKELMVVGAKPDGAAETKAPAVYCGEQAAGGMVLGDGLASVVGIPQGLEGPLRLRAGPRPARTLRYAGLRPTPTLSTGPRK
jgi:HEAT repeat protein